MIRTARLVAARMTTRVPLFRLTLSERCFPDLHVRLYLTQLPCCREERRMFSRWRDSVRSKGEMLDHSTVIQRNSAEKTIRRATVSDISALLEVEKRSFESDRLTRRNF